MTVFKGLSQHIGEEFDLLADLVGKHFSLYEVDPYDAVKLCLYEDDIVLCKWAYEKCSGRIVKTERERLATMLPGNSHYLNQVVVRFHVHSDHKACVLPPDYADIDKYVTANPDAPPDLVKKYAPLVEAWVERVCDVALAKHMFSILDVDNKLRRENIRYALPCIQPILRKVAHRLDGKLSEEARHWANKLTHPLPSHHMQLFVDMRQAIQHVGPPMAAALLLENKTIVTSKDYAFVSLSAHNENNWANDIRHKMWPSSRLRINRGLSL